MPEQTRIRRTGGRLHILNYDVVDWKFTNTKFTDNVAQDTIAISENEKSSFTSNITGDITASGKYNHPMNNMDMSFWPAGGPRQVEYKIKYVDKD